MKTVLMLIVLDFIVLTSFTKTNTTNCIATWYDRHGALTASGVRMHRDSATCAYNALPMGTKLLITNIQNNKQCVAVITDRMGDKTPNKIDLSYKTFGNLANHKQGVIKVRISRLN